MAKILLLEDEVPTGMYEERLLKQAGYEVIWCSDSEEAKAGLGQLPDFVLLDWKQPTAVDKTCEGFVRQCLIGTAIPFAWLTNSLDEVPEELRSAAKFRFTGKIGMFHGDSGVLECLAKHFKND